MSPPLAVISATSYSARHRPPIAPLPPHSTRTSCLCHGTIPTDPGASFIWGWPAHALMALRAPFSEKATESATRSCLRGRRTDDVPASVICLAVNARRDGASDGASALVSPRPPLPVVPGNNRGVFTRCRLAGPKSAAGKSKGSAFYRGTSNRSRPCLPRSHPQLRAASPTNANPLVPGSGTGGGSACIW